MSLEKGASIVLEQCLGVKPDEPVLIVTDTEKRLIGKELL